MWIPAIVVYLSSACWFLVRWIGTDAPEDPPPERELLPVGSSTIRLNPGVQMDTIMSVRHET
jgi:hypothetical protein